MNSFVQWGSLQMVCKQESLEMQQAITPGSAPAFPIHSVCRPGVCLLEISAQTKSLAAAIPPPIHTRPAPLSLLLAFLLLYPPSVHPIFSLIWSHFFDLSQEHRSLSPTKAPLIPTEGWQQLSCNKGTFKSKAYANQFLYEGTILHLFPFLSNWLFWELILLLFLKQMFSVLLISGAESGPN